MTTIEQSQDLYESLSDVMGIIDEQIQEELFCSHWGCHSNDYVKVCNRQCPALAETTIPHCLFDKARKLVEKIEEL